MFFFSYFMNNRYTDWLTFEKIHITLKLIQILIAILFSVLICLKKGEKLWLSVFEVFNSNVNILKWYKSLVSENFHALSENIYLMYSKVLFAIRNLSFQENVKTKVYA